MLDCQLAILENALVRYQVDGKSPGALGTRHPTITPFQAFRASDAWFVVAVGNDALWKTFCAAVERPDLFADARFATNGDRTKHYVELIPELERLFDKKPAGEWLALLEKAGVPAAPVKHDRQGDAGPPARRAQHVRNGGGQGRGHDHDTG
jgi:CoA:oxalate CoA-transferase